METVCEPCHALWWDSFRRTAYNLKGQQALPYLYGIMVMRHKLLPTIQEQFGDEQCLFQHDGPPCHRAKVITKWLGEQNINILGPWPGNSPDLNPIENLWSILKRRVDKQKPTNSDKLQALFMQEWAAISQDVAQKLI